ncbi:MAG: CHAT domain-containing protein [Deltaproteobacteria bacterium]|nr:CHAT domain-containing protein [Deltaproteobacteria bacterium]
MRPPQKSPSPSRRILGWLSSAGWIAALAATLGLSLASVPVSTMEKEKLRQPAALLQEGRDLVEATDFGQAFQVLQEALKTYEAEGDIEGQARALIALAYALKESHAQDRGLGRLEQALLLAPKASSPALEAEILTLLARTRLPLGQIPQAWKDLEKAERLFAELEDPLGIARADSARSSLSVHTGAYREAIRTGRKALPVLEEAGALDHALTALSSIAYGHHKLEEYDPALEAYERVLELGWEKNDQRMINFAFCNRAEIRWLKGVRKPALEDLRRAIDGFEEARERVPGTADQRADYLARQVEAYERLIRFLGDTYQGQQAFEIAERFHGRSFLELLDDQTLALLRPTQGVGQQRREELLEDLGKSRLELEEGLDPGLAKTTRNRIATLEGQLEKAEAEALGRGRHFRRLATPKPPSIEEVQAGLKPEEALVAYWVARDRIFIWVIDSKGATSAQVPVTRDQLEETVQLYLANLRSPREAKDAALEASEPAHLELGRTLHHWLIDSMPLKGRRAQRWVLVPDGILHYLPFEALVASCENPAASSTASSSAPLHAPYLDCQYLGLEKAISYSPSAGVFLALRERHRERLDTGKRRPDLLALAPNFDPSVVQQETLQRAVRQRGPLLFTKDEVERISALFQRDSSPLLDHLATERRLKDIGGRYRLLHLATHGLVSDELPMSSGLLLGAGEGEDGLLQAHEVLGMHLEADLVTLSACSTGRGGLSRGEGIVGLSRSFLTAGASSVVVSLWDVDDRSTPVLMETFYRHLAEGVAPAEALLEARRALFETTDNGTFVLRPRRVSYAHPRFWAPFIVVGGW